MIDECNTMIWLIIYCDYNDDWYVVDECINVYNNRVYSHHISIVE